VKSNFGVALGIQMAVENIVMGAVDLADAVRVLSTAPARHARDLEIIETVDEEEVTDGQTYRWAVSSRSGGGVDVEGELEHPYMTAALYLCAFAGRFAAAGVALR